MRLFKSIFLTLAATVVSAAGLFAQQNIGNSLEMDKMVHNFGDVIHKSGPVSCTFTLKNNGSKPAVK